MLAQLPNNSYLCKCKDSSGVATLRKGQTDSLSLLSFVGIIHNVGLMNKEQEIWKPVVGFEGYYEVSNLGRVRSVDRVLTLSDNRVYHYPTKILSPSNVGSGYLSVELNKCGYKKRCLVHRLVAMAFIPNPSNKTDVDHINTSREDNRVENLRWVTKKENSNNPLTRERLTKIVQSTDFKERVIQTRKVKKIWSSPITVYQFSLDGVLVAVHESASSASKLIGVPAKCISYACKHPNHTSGGFLWSYSPEARPYVKRAKCVCAYTKDRKFINKYLSAKDASLKLNINAKAIKSCCYKNQQSFTYSAGGYIWQYADEDNNNKTK